MLPTLWFRNTWSLGLRRPPERPSLRLHGDRVVGEPLPVRAARPGRRRRCRSRCSATTRPTTSGCSASRTSRRIPRTASTTTSCTAPRRSTRDREGTKAALHYDVTVPPGESHGDQGPAGRGAAPARRDPRLAAPIDLGAGFDAVIAARRRRRTRSTPTVIPRTSRTEEARVLRQAFAGLLWGKQFYHYDVDRWLDGDPGQPPPPPGRGDDPQRRLAAPEQPRGPADAGPVGVPVVRRLGPGLPLRDARAHRPAVRQGPAHPAAARVVHAPERADPGLRVELLRRQPAGARLGGAAGVRASTAAPTTCSWPGSSTSCSSTSPGG